MLLSPAISSLPDCFNHFYEKWKKHGYDIHDFRYVNEETNQSWRQTNHTERLNTHAQNIIEVNERRTGLPPQSEPRNDKRFLDMINISLRRSYDFRTYMCV